jgi:hypothetical protein
MRKKRVVDSGPCSIKLFSNIEGSAKRIVNGKAEIVLNSGMSMNEPKPAPLPTVQYTIVPDEE